MLHMKKLFALIILLCVTMSAYAEVVLNGVFADHMVLQRDIPVSLYGVAAPGEKVTVAFAGQEKSATADKEGAWSVKLDAMKVSTTPAAMTVSEKNKITLNDIVIGDVWICSGQSNMEWVLGACNRPDDLKQANFPLIRLFQMRGVVSSQPRTEVRCFPWAPCTPQSVENFPAVGFYFGRKVHQETGIPLGLIRSAQGGTAIEPWTPYAGLALIPELAKDKEQLDKQIRNYVNALAVLQPKVATYVVEAQKALSNNADMPALLEFPAYPISNNAPQGWNCLYNGYIHPLTRFAIKGVLWYQGESNCNNADTYFAKQRALIGSWRKAWNQGDFPFYFVQLANYGNPTDNPGADDRGWAKLRMAQLKSLAVPNTGMAVAIELADVGNPGDVHAKNKKDVGERLSLWALAKDYGKKDLVYSGPLYKDMKIEGAKIRISFDSVGSGLTIATKKGYDPMVKDPHGKLQKFAIAGEDKKWVWGDAVIDGTNVVVSSPSVAKPVAVRYAFSSNPDGCNLYNNEGLPASPFRTDEW
ncbi:MAG: sialate O-acetylesterase [Planctomycetota bacterium]